MPLIGQIAAQLSADNSDFRSKMSEAGQAVEGFDKQVKKFGLGFGGVAALATAFRAIVDYARDLENPMDENLKRAKAFAGGLDEAKGAMLELGAKALGVVNGLGEWMGRQVAILKYGRQQVELGEQIEKQTKETLAAIEKDKQRTEEIARLKKQIQEIDAKTAADLEKQMDLSERILRAESRLQAAKDEVSKAGDDRLAAAKAELQVAQARNDLEKVRAEKTKQSADAEKKAADEAEKQREKHIDTLREIERMRFEQLSTQEKIYTYEESIRNVSAMIAENKKKGVIDDELTLALMENQRDLDKAQVQLANEQAAAEKKVTKEIENQTEALTIQFKVRGRRDQDLSDRVLEDKIRTLTASLSARNARKFVTPGGVGGFGDYDPMIFEETKELARVKNELQARQKIREQVGMYGEEGAARFYSGNIPEFERLLQFVGDVNVQKKTLTVLEEVNQRLANNGWFPRR